MTGWKGGMILDQGEESRWWDVVGEIVGEVGRRGGTWYQDHDRRGGLDVDGDRSCRGFGVDDDGVGS